MQQKIASQQKHFFIFYLYRNKVKNIVTYIISVEDCNSKETFRLFSTNTGTPHVICNHGVFLYNCSIGLFSGMAIYCINTNFYSSTPRNFFARIPTTKDRTATPVEIRAISRKRRLKGWSWATEV